MIALQVCVKKQMYCFFRKIIVIDKLKKQTGIRILQREVNAVMLISPNLLLVRLRLLFVS
jgi:hypothetical protein